MSIDIDEDLDERGASTQLESITKHLSLTCIFTVMQNTISALESLEYISFDMCFIADNMSDNCSMGAFEFLRVSRIIGCTMPIVLLTNDESDPNQDGLPPIGFHPSDPTLVKFSALLLRPYTRSELCMLICHAFTIPSPKGNDEDGMDLSTSHSGSQLFTSSFTAMNTDSNSAAADTQEGLYHMQSLPSSGSALDWGFKESTSTDNQRFYRNASLSASAASYTKTESVQRNFGQKVHGRIQQYDPQQQSTTVFHYLTTK